MPAGLRLLDDGSQLSDFALDDDADATLSNTQLFTFPGDGFGSKTITEALVAGWCYPAWTAPRSPRTGRRRHTRSIRATTSCAPTRTARTRPSRSSRTPSPTLRRTSTTPPPARPGATSRSMTTPTRRFEPATLTFPGGEFGSKTVTEAVVAGWANRAGLLGGHGRRVDRDAGCRSGRRHHLYLRQQEGREADDRQGRSA